MTNGRQYRHVFVASDNQPASLKRLKQLRLEYEHVYTRFDLMRSDGGYGLAIDMHILSRSESFIGIPASTVAQNVAAMRAGRASYVWDGGTTETLINLVVPCGTREGNWVNPRS